MISLAPKHSQEDEACIIWLPDLKHSEGWVEKVHTLYLGIYQID